jgi:hypothetical protein
MPTTLRAPLCIVQEIPLYSCAASFAEVNEDTQLLVFKSCSITDVWRDREVIRKQLDHMNVVFLCTDRRVDDGQSAQLARRLGMVESGVRPFYVVSSRDMEEAADERESAAVVEASDRRRLIVLQQQLAAVRAYQRQLAAGRRPGL